MSVAAAVPFRYPKRPRNLDQYETAECPTCHGEVLITKQTVARTKERGAEFRVQCPKCKTWLKGRG